jgi:nucleotide-binding universal stress UspA family protein
MTSKHQAVVVAYDFSPVGAAVLARAVALVSRAPSHILHFVTAIDAHAGIPAVPHKGRVDHHYADQVRDAMSEEVRKAFGSAPIPDEVHFFVHARIGKPPQEILELAEDVGADLILVGTHGYTGVQRLVMGSTAEQVVRTAGCPVLVVRVKRYNDIELPKVTEVASTEHHHSAKGFSYHKDTMTLRPYEWPM